MNVLFSNDDFDSYRKQQINEYDHYRENERRNFEKFYLEHYELNHKIFEAENTQTLERLKLIDISEEQIAYITHKYENQISFSIGPYPNQVVIIIDVRIKNDFEQNFLSELNRTHNVNIMLDNDKIFYAVSKKNKTHLIKVLHDDIKTSFLNTLKNHKLSDNIIEVIRYNIEGKVAIESVSKSNDRFKIMYEENIIEGTTTKDIKLLYLSYKNDKGIDLEGYLFDPNGKILFLTNGEKMSTSISRLPLDKINISSPFGIRTHPIYKTKLMHNGIDYKSPKGTPVYAVSNGIVKKTSKAYNGGFGNMIEIEHENNDVTLYAHLDTIRIKKGDMVKLGTIIGTVGSTGTSTGNHLHFGYMVKNKWVNPSVLQLQASSKLQGEDLKKFQTQIKKINSLMKENE